MTLYKKELLKKSGLPPELVDDMFSIRPRHYKLDENKKVVPCSMVEWSVFHSSPYRIVAQVHINDCFISTVFLGTDHSFYKDKIIVFETMVFDKDDQDIYCMRYSTWEEAEKGHHGAIEWVKNGCIDDEI